MLLQLLRCLWELLTGEALAGVCVRLCLGVGVSSVRV